jgi:hypothetical protein
MLNCMFRWMTVQSKVISKEQTPVSNASERAALSESQNQTNDQKMKETDDNEKTE